MVVKRTLDGCGAMSAYGPKADILAVWLRRWSLEMRPTLLSQTGICGAIPVSMSQPRSLPFARFHEHFFNSIDLKRTTVPQTMDCFSYEAFW